MKTILKIMTILLVAALVSGGFWLAVNNTSTTSGADAPAMSNGAGAPTRPEGGRDGGKGGSLAGGVGGVLLTLAKLSGITVIVLLVQKAISLMPKKNSLKTA